MASSSSRSRGFRMARRARRLVVDEPDRNRVQVVQASPDRAQGHMASACFSRLGWVGDERTLLAATAPRGGAELATRVRPRAAVTAVQAALGVTLAALAFGAPDGVAPYQATASPGRAAPAATSPPPSRVRPLEITAAGRIRCRGRRCAVHLRGSVKRPKAVARCTGKARLRVATGRRRLLSTRIRVRRSCRYRATRRFSLRSERTRTVTLRVSYLGDAKLLPRRGRAVRVKLQPKAAPAR